MDKLNLKDLTVSDLLNRYLMLVQGKGDPQPDENTTLSPELVELLIEDLESVGGPMGRRMVYFDSEANELRNGINFRV